MKNKLEIVLPALYNTIKKPEKPNNYSCWVHPKENKVEFYINGKWFYCSHIEQDTIENKIEKNVVTDKEMNLIKAIREYLGEV